MLEMYQGGVKVMILRDSAECLADDEGRSPLDLEKCPCGYETCSSGCAWYAEQGCLNAYAEAKLTFKGGIETMDCTSCMYEYMCDWTEAEASECSHYRPDLEHKETEDDT